MSGLTFADSIGTAYPFELTSSNGKYKLTSIPYFIQGTTQWGKSTVVEIESNKELYTVDRYFPDYVALSNDGMVIVAANYWAYRLSPLASIAIEFYKEGKLTRRYLVDDVLEDKSTLIPTTSHYLWTFDKKWEDKDCIHQMIDDNSIFTSNDTLYVATSDTQLLYFDLHNHVQKQLGKAYDQYTYLYKNPRDYNKVIYNRDVDYPDSYSFPKTQDDLTFDQLLKVNFKEEQRQFYNERFNYFWVLVGVDKAGKGTLYDFSPVYWYKYKSLKEEEKMRLESEFKAILNTSLNSVKFSTNLNPEHVDTWIYMKSFNFKREN